jgi:hypothetical protein
MADEQNLAPGHVAYKPRAGPQASDLTKNVFWISATLTFDLQTGASNQILTFAYREEDATNLTETEAEAYLRFVKVRAERFAAGIKWFVEPSKLRPKRFVIRGEQDAP